METNDDKHMTIMNNTPLTTTHQQTGLDNPSTDKTTDLLEIAQDIDINHLPTLSQSNYLSNKTIIQLPNIVQQQISNNEDLQWVQSYPRQDIVVSANQNKHVLQNNQSKQGEHKADRQVNIELTIGKIEQRDRVGQDVQKGRNEEEGEIESYKNGLIGMNIVEGEEDMVWGQTNMRQIDDQGQKDVEQMDMKIEEQAEGHDEDDQFGDFEESHTLVQNPSSVGQNPLISNTNTVSYTNQNSFPQDNIPSTDNLNVLQQFIDNLPDYSFLFKIVFTD